MFRSLLIGAIASLSYAYDFTGFHSIDLWGSSIAAGDKPQFNFYFKVEGNKATLGAEVKTDSEKWFSVGLTSSGGMIGADYAIFTPVDRDGAYTVADYWSEGFYMPSLDENQNLQLVESSTENGITTVVWERSVDSCDQEEDLDMLSHPQVIFAIGYGEDLGYHQHRGSNSVDWLNGDLTAVQDAALEDDVIIKTFQPKEPLAIDGDKKTQYKCVSGSWTLPKDHHSVKVEPIADSRFIHHMLFFACPTETVTYDGQTFEHEQAFDCSVMPPEGCISLSGWAVGGKSQYAGEEYGMLIPSDTKTWFIQYHYDNYKLEEGGLDRSGARFYLTPTLRPNHLGTVVMGVPAVLPTKEIALTPGKETIELTSELPYDCSMKMATESVQIVGVGFHMHKYGKYSYLEHWRDGERLDDIAWQHWDFNFQTPQEMPKERWIEFRRGDALRLHCLYDTTDAEDVVLGGDGSNDEMCLVFIRTFPPTDIQRVMQMDKLTNMIGMPDKTLCVSIPGVHNGLGSGTGPDAEQGGLASMQGLKKHLVSKSLTETSQGRLIHPRDCEEEASSPTSTSPRGRDEEEAQTEPASDGDAAETDASSNSPSTTRSTSTNAETDASSNSPSSTSTTATTSTSTSTTPSTTTPTTTASTSTASTVGQNEAQSDDASSTVSDKVERKVEEDSLADVQTASQYDDSNSARGTAIGSSLLLAGLLQAIVLLALPAL